MSRYERAKRVDELEGKNSPHDEPDRLKPRPPAWLIDRILEACQGQPDPMLSAWLASRQVYPNEISQWRSDHSPTRDWEDPNVVMRASASLDGHPMRGYLGGMLSALVQRHAPHNVKFLHPDFIPTQEAR